MFRGLLGRSSDRVGMLTKEDGEPFPRSGKKFHKNEFCIYSIEIVYLLSSGGKTAMHDPMGVRFMSWY